MSTDGPARRVLPRTLAGATILQIVPALRDDAIGRSAVEVAQALLLAGARAIVAGEGGSLVVELRAFGGEWAPFPSRGANPLQLRRNTGWLQNFAATHQIDLIHAHSIGSAWSALAATKRLPVWLVASLPDVPKLPAGQQRYLRALRRADQIVAPSDFVLAQMTARYGIPRDKIVVIPRLVDTVYFDPASARRERVVAMRQSWRLRPGDPAIAVPGRVAPWNGQLALVDAARLLVNGGLQGARFVLVGDTRDQKGYVRAVRRRIVALGVEGQFRIVGHCPDMPTALAAADIVVVPALETPVLGRLVAEAQAMGRPTIASQVGMLGEYVLSPPRSTDQERTGWTVKPGDPRELALAIATALSITADDYDAMAARARAFAERTFSRDSVVAATCAVYAGLLARER